jgi:hypothetical protein
MYTFRITYARTSYMEIDVDAEDCREAEARFEALAAAEPVACERGEALTVPRYRVVDVTVIVKTVSSEKAPLAA